MDIVEELLPGIEEFLAGTLATEQLSSFAEERRQFFLERLDIVRLPPSVPPREGRSLPPELLKETEETSGIPAARRGSDFAATQRLISRSFRDPSPSQDPEPDGSSLGKKIKIYDDIEDIDQLDSTVEQDASRQEQDRRSQRASSLDCNIVDDSQEDHDENGLYEIPVTRLSVEDNSVTYGTDGSSPAPMESSEDISDEAPETKAATLPRVPTPRVARKGLTLSESGSRDSLDVDTRPPELPFRPPLPKRNEIYSTNDKSDRSETEKSVTSDPELSGEGDSTSYESFEEDNDQATTDRANTLEVQLPTKSNQKSSLRRGRRSGKSRSPTRRDISVPFRKLSNIDISGEMLHKGKLKWNRRVGAISDGCLVIYKTHKNSRPLLVIPLVGYEASVNEREGKKGFEVKLVHADDDPHTFSVDLKEWATHWIEHINGNAKKQPPSKYHTHLARSCSEGPPDCALTVATDEIKNELAGSNSNLSNEGGAQENSKDKIKRTKVKRMGSFASRASRFLENIGKRTSGGRKGRDSSAPGYRHSGGDSLELPSSPVQSSLSAGNLSNDALSPASDSSATSVFSSSYRAASLPPTPRDADSPTLKLWQTGTETVTTTCEGHLSVYSSFNKRCWGRRWCQVRGNVFECYKSETSEHCELCFNLRPCALRRAAAEIHSDNGLMLLEAGKEKITVETMSRDEMGRWVRVLLKETTNDGVPEGLQEFLEGHDGSGSDEADTPFTGRNLSAHDYEDPEETVAAAAILKASSQDAGQAAFTPGQGDDQASLIFKDRKEAVRDYAPASSAYKQTTDSGFYSVRGANSDSDSGSENASPCVGKSDSSFSAVESQPWNSTRHFRSSGKLTVDFVQAGRDKSAAPRTAVHETLSRQTVASSLSSSPSSSGSRQPSSPSTRSRPNHLAPLKSSHPHQVYHHHQKDHPHQKDHHHQKDHPRQKKGTSINESSTSAADAIFSSEEAYSTVLKRSERESKAHNSPAGSSKTIPDNSHSSTTDRLPDGLSVGSDKAVQADNKNTTSHSVTTTGHDPIVREQALGQISTTTKTLTQALADNTSTSYFPETNGDQTPPLPQSPQPDLRKPKSEWISRPFSDSKSGVGEAGHVAASSGRLSLTSKRQGGTDTTQDGSPVSPTSDKIADLIRQPKTTPGEIRAMIDSLKIKQAVSKRRRMAVHEKRQRNLSDEERLACEKEFAALEKEGEITERSIRVLQNHLDTIQGQTIESMKATSQKQTIESMKATSQKQTIESMKGQPREIFSKLHHR